MDCGGVLLTVDRRCLPSAATTAAETPATATTGAVGQFSGAAWARTSAHGDASQCSGAVEHAFENRTARTAGSASLQSEAKISMIGRTNPPAQLVCGERFEGSRVRHRRTFTTEWAAINFRQALTREIGRTRVEASALALCTLSPAPNCTGDAAPSWARAWLSWHQLERFRCAFRFQRCISNRCLAVGP